LSIVGMTDKNMNIHIEWIKSIPTWQKTELGFEGRKDKDHRALGDGVAKTQSLEWSNHSKQILLKIDQCGS
jgi:hypothetical protein